MRDKSWMETEDIILGKAKYEDWRFLELRPSGFSESDPPHLCENLTCNGIEFAYQYILGITKQ